MKLRHLSVAVFALLLFGAIVSSEAIGRPLERNQIIRFHVTSVPSGDVTYLHIRGLPLDSFASGCSNLDVKTTGDEVWLRANMLLTKGGGPFDYVVTIPSGIKRVVFGDSRKEIWPKDEESRSYSEGEQKALEAAKREFMRSKPDLGPDDYYEFVEDNPVPALKPEATGHYTVVFYQDGPTPSSVRDLYHYWVSTSDDAVTYKGRAYAGQMLLLEQLGKTEGLPAGLVKLNLQHPNAKVESRQL
ncbi:MAG TPA: hypothetical protein V6D22_20375 [Candidatus Obscuribacterales bacterium]